MPNVSVGKCACCPSIGVEIRDDDRTWPTRLICAECFDEIESATRENVEESCEAVFGVRGWVF